MLDGPADCQVPLPYQQDSQEHRAAEGDVATLGPSWKFSPAENLASLSLQDGPQSGIIIQNLLNEV